MKKIMLIGWKDVKLAFRDRAALVLMLAAPFLLTLGMGFVTGRFSGSSNIGLSEIPVVIVNLDQEQLGNQLVDVFQSDELGTLINLTLLNDPDLARQQVDQDEYASAVIIPAGFTDSILTPDGATNDELVQIQVYKNPSRPTSSSIILSMVEEFVNRVEIGRVGSQVIITGLLRDGLLPMQDVERTAQELGIGLSNTSEYSSITLKNVTSQGEEIRFDILAFMAPGMALMFLMFTVSNGGRTLLVERMQGTLPRLLVSPTSTSQVLGGKIFGIFLTGVVQMLLLIITSTIFFQLHWGDPLGVLVLVLSAVFGAVGWGLVITSIANNPGQVGAVGSAIMLIFGILGGSFISLDQMPGWLQLISRVTPNSWGLNGFTTLAMGGKLVDIWESVAALIIMGVALFTLTTVIYNRKGGIQG